MRLLLGSLVLLTLFGAAALWQRSWTSAARSSRASFHGEASETGVRPPEGWGRVVVGRPSGGEPYTSPVDAPSPRSTDRSTPDPAEPSTLATDPESGLPPPPLTRGEDPSVVVKAGQTLSEICHEHYGSARQSLLLALAHYNHLETPDAIREGQVIRLPPSERLDGHH